MNEVLPFWTDERVEQLKVLWDDGKSAAVIFRTMGAPSRNSVLSKVHRLGLAGRMPHAAPRKTRETVKRSYTPRTMAVPPPADEPVAIVLEDGLHVTLLTVTFDQCRWPKWGDNEHETFRVCGHRQAPSSSYCPYHAHKSQGHGSRSERNAA